MAANVSIFFIFMDFYLRVVDVVPVVLVELLPVLRVVPVPVLRVVVDVLPELLVAELPELLLVAVELELPLRTVDCCPEAVVVLVLVLLLPEDWTRLEVVDEPDLVAELLEDVLRVADVPVVRPVEVEVEAELRDVPVPLEAVPRVLLPDVVPEVEVPRLALPVLDELVPDLWLRLTRSRLKFPWSHLSLWRLTSLWSHLSRKTPMSPLWRCFRPWRLCLLSPMCLNLNCVWRM